MTTAARSRRERRTWRQRASTAATYALVFAVVGVLAFGAILAYRQLSIPLADRIASSPILSVRPTTVPVWVDPVGLEGGALFGLRPVPLVAAVGLSVGPAVAVALAAGLGWWWTDRSSSGRLPPLARLGYLVGYAFVTTGPLYVLVPWLRDLESRIAQPELALLIGVAIIATGLWVGIVLVIAVASIQWGKAASLWSMPLSQFERAAIFAGTVVLALLVLAFGSWSTPRFGQVSWVGIAGVIGIVATILIAGRLFVAPVTIIRDGRGPIEAIRWSNESIADSGTTWKAVLIVFWVGVLVRWAATLATFPSDPVVGLALATVVGTALVGSLHAMAMARIYRDVQQHSTTDLSITDIG